MKSIFNEFVVAVQSLEPTWFYTIWLAFLALSLHFFIKYFKSAKFAEDKPGNFMYFVIAVVFIILLVGFTHLRIS